MKRLFLLLTTSIFLCSCGSSKYPELGDGIFADIQTNRGDIIVKLHHEATPLTVANFVSLAEGANPFVTIDSIKGKRYYDGLIFHRVIKDFMIQGGDILGDGTGGPGYEFKDEPVDTLKHDGPGVLSMANSGPATNGSQFFITHKKTPWLNGRHTVFGRVVAGNQVVDSIANTTVSDDGTNKPLENVVMNRVEIVRQGSDAKKFDAVDVMSTYFEEKAEKEKAVEAKKQDLLTEFTSQKPNALTKDSGLQIHWINRTEGAKPKIGQKVRVNYAGYLAANAQLFDSNIAEVERGFNKFNPNKQKAGQYNPIPMDYSPEARLINGFKEGLMEMKVGDKVRLFIPSHLGYGPQSIPPGANPPLIPGNSDLVFDLEITSID